MFTKLFGYLYVRNLADLREHTQCCMQRSIPLILIHSARPTARDGASLLRPARGPPSVRFEPLTKIFQRPLSSKLERIKLFVPCFSHGFPCSGWQVVSAWKSWETYPGLEATIFLHVPPAREYALIFLATYAPHQRLQHPATCSRHRSSIKRSSARRAWASLCNDFSVSSSHR